MYKQYLKSQWWRDTKKYLTYVKKKKCYICGFKQKLHVHHKSYGSLGYEDGTELVYLCKRCHLKLHWLDGKVYVPDTPMKSEFLERRMERFKKREEFKKQEKLRKEKESRYTIGELRRMKKPISIADFESGECFKKPIQPTK